MQIKTTSRWSEWSLIKNIETVNAGQDVEKMWKKKSSCTVGGKVNGYSHYGEQYGDSLKN